MEWLPASTPQRPDVAIVDGVDYLPPLPRDLMWLLWMEWLPASTPQWPDVAIVDEVGYLPQPQDEALLEGVASWDIQFMMCNWLTVKNRTMQPVT